MYQNSGFVCVDPTVCCWIWFSNEFVDFLIDNLPLALTIAHGTKTKGGWVLLALCCVAHLKLIVSHHHCHNGSGSPLLRDLVCLVQEQGVFKVQAGSPRTLGHCGFHEQKHLKNMNVLFKLGVVCAPRFYIVIKWRPDMVPKVSALQKLTWKAFLFVSYKFPYFYVLNNQLKSSENIWVFL